MPLTAIQRRYSFEERTRRAEQLENQWPFAAEILRTYRLVLQFQQSLSVMLKKLRPNGHSHDRLPDRIDLSPFVHQFQSLLTMTAKSAPEALVAGAKHVKSADSHRLIDLLNTYWTDTYDGSDPTEAFLLHAFLQPIAEHFATNADVSTRSSSLCPYCGRKPVCGVLRPEGDGAKRSLLCSFCSTEWDYRRLICPACEQEEVEKLPVYTAEEFKFIRVEACDLCRTFIKTIDLTKDGRAIPSVDEIASLPLTLWAEEKGYHKLHPNLLLM